MKRYILFFALLFSFAAVPAQRVAKKVSNARQAVVSVLAFRQGELMGSGTAVFVGEAGEVLAGYSLLAGADSAVTIDPAGKVRPIERILGVNEIFNCVRARVAWDRKIESLTVAATGVSVGQELYMLSYGAKKSGVVTPLSVAAVDSAYSNGYYTFAFPMKEHYLSLPVVNDKGELVGIMQPVSARETTNSYAVSPMFASSLVPHSLNYARGYYPGMGIRTALPADKEAAMSCMYMQAIMGNNVSYSATIEDFIAQFPNSYEGYLSRAEYQAVYMRDMNVASASWDKALSLADNDAEVYFGKAKVINSIVQSGDTLSSPMLSYSNALDALNRAIELDNQPIYVNYKADMLLANKEYAAASSCYESLASTSLRSPDIFASASRCQEKLGDFDRSIALLDSAVCCFASDSVPAAAPYLLLRAVAKMSAGKYRDAVFDYNRYDVVVGAPHPASFYYLREQAELAAKMYQQALNDIDTAIYLDPQHVLYYVEKAVLCYRVRMTDEGITALETAIGLAQGTENAEIYYLLGRLYIQASNTDKARENLEKALSLGSTAAGELLDGLSAQ